MGTLSLQSRAILLLLSFRLQKFTADIKPVLPSVPQDARNPFAYMHFADENSQNTLDTVIVDHLVREGQVEAARVFSDVSSVSESHVII